MQKTLLELGALVIDADTVINEASYLIIENGHVAEFGRGKYRGLREDLTIIARPRTIAIPGLVDSHGHAAMTLLRGAGDDVPLMTWLHKKIFPLEQKMTEEAVYWGTQLACWEMIRSGTTTFADMYFHMHQAARAVEESGLRGVLAYSVAGQSQSDVSRELQQTHDFISTWHGAAGGRITTTLGPHAPYSCSSQLLQSVTQMSFDLGIPIQIHVSETQSEVAESLGKHRMTPVQYLAEIGMFERPVLAAHCVTVSEQDIQILHDYDVRVAHNPQSNLKLGSGIAPVAGMLAKGLTVGLGTDGAASNNNLDMFEEMRLAATLHKGFNQQADVVTAPQALKMATADSARAVFLGTLDGTLNVGATADITLLDLTSPHFLPNHNLLSNIVYAAGADDVCDVFVAGTQLLSNRELLSLDTERIRYEITRIQGEMLTVSQSSHS
jgi:5-methylthioadenosine/S-adenosylhomocysteine deaminase